jgi:hypothetical protein
MLTILGSLVNYAMLKLSFPYGSESEKYLHNSCPCTEGADIKHQQKIVISSKMP